MGRVPFFSLRGSRLSLHKRNWHPVPRSTEGAVRGTKRPARAKDVGDARGGRPPRRRVDAVLNLQNLGFGDDALPIWDLSESDT